jgi:hypothetical protein
VSFVVKELTQIRKHIPAVVVIPCAGTLESIEFSRGECRGSNWQRHGLIEALLAGKTNSSITSLIYMFVAIASPAFHTGPQRRIITTVWNEIPNDHFALFSHEASVVPRHHGLAVHFTL